MAHASGNSPWQPYPDTSTPVSAARLESMENAIDAASAGSRPLVEVRLTADYASLAVGAYFLMRGQMASPTGMDPFSMFKQPGGSGQPYQLVVPSGWPGRYGLEWQVAADGGGYNPLIIFGCLNASDTQANDNGVFNTIAMRNQVPGMGQCGGSAVLGVGDKIALGVYNAGSSGTWNMRAVLGSYHRTKAVLRWLGPT